MGCSAGGQDTMASLVDPSGVCHASGSGVFRCPRCGRFVPETLVCANPRCLTDWSIYANLRQYDQDTANQILRFSDYRAAILPRSGEPLTAITEELVANARDCGKNGVYLQLGGDDIEDMFAQVQVAEDGNGGERAILLMKVRADLPYSKVQSSSAEEKVLSMLNAAQPIGYRSRFWDETATASQLPFDQQNYIASDLRYLFKELTRIGKHDPYQMSYEKLMQIQKTINQKQASPNLTAQELQMCEHYQKIVADLLAVVQNRMKTGKKKIIHPTVLFDSIPFYVYSGDYVVKDKLLPQLPPGEGLPTKRISGAMVITPSGVLDDQNRSYFSGYSGYEIDLGDGWKANYYSHSEDTCFAQRGTLQIISPKGRTVDADTVAEGVYRMRQLNLNGTLASKGDAETMYLARNLWALEKTNDSAFVDAMTWTQEDQDALNATLGREILSLKLPDDLLSQPSTAQRILLDAQEEIKQGKRKRRLRQLLAETLGMKVEEMLRDPDYMKRREGQVMGKSGRPVTTGLVAWNRMDASIRRRNGTLTNDRKLVHNLTGDKMNNFKRVIQNGGVLWSTYRRRMLGMTTSGRTLSPDDDMQSGGGGYMFTYIKGQKDDTDDIAMVWDAADFAEYNNAFWYNGDKFGSINVLYERYENTLSTSLDKIETREYRFGEFMSKDGISLLTNPPKQIIARSTDNRDELIQSFKAGGMHQLGGRKIEDIIIISD